MELFCIEVATLFVEYGIGEFCKVVSTYLICSCFALSTNNFFGMRKEDCFQLWHQTEDSNEEYRKRNDSITSSGRKKKCKPDANKMEEHVSLGAAVIMRLSILSSCFTSF